MRFIDSLMISPRSGVLTIILQQIVKRDLGSWVGLVSFVTVGYAVAFSILMPGASTEPRVSLRPYAIPFWSLLGDFDIEAL